MPASIISIETFPLLPLALPLIGMAISFRRRKEEGGEEEPLAAYQLLVESTFDGVLALSSEGQVIWVDERFLNFMGYEAAEIEKQPFTALVDPGDVEKVYQYLSQSIQQAQTFEVHAIDKKGSVHILQLIATLCGETDEPEIIMGVRDISEEDSLRKRLVFTEKMDLLSRVMNSIGGDLGRISATLGPMAESAGDPKLQETLAWLSDLEHRIDLFPRRGIKDGSDINIPELLETAVASQKDEDPGSPCEINLEIEDGTFPVFGDMEQLTEAVRNVLRNACQAAESTGGDVMVACCPFTVGRATPRRGFILPPGEYIHLSISDTGPGIPPEIIDHVFDPMFSTKLGSPLAGLGLAVTYTVVKNHRGYVDMESTQGSGTTVDFFLPRSRLKESIEEAPATATAEEAVEAEPAPAEVEKVVEVSVEETLVIEHEAVVAEAKTAETEVGSEEEAVVGEEAEVEVTEEEEEEEAVEEEQAEEEEIEVEVKIEVEAAEEEEVEEEEPEEETAEEEILDEDEIGSLSGHETVLVIEEDHEIRSYILDILGNFGYNALPARNWVEGVDLFKRHARLVDLVLLNVMVPEMVWVKTLMDLRRVTPEARIGMMGEDEATDTMVRYLEMPGISHLIKPLTTANLMRGVRLSLDELLE